jgi:hypothetical protein
VNRVTTAMPTMRADDRVAAGDHTPVIAAMQDLLPSDDLLFLMDLSIDPVLAMLNTERP